MPCPTELLGCSKSRRTRSDDRDTSAAFVPGNLRNNPTLHPPHLCDTQFDMLAYRCREIDRQGTGGFTKCRTDSPGYLGKVVGGVKYVQSLSPVSLDDGIGVIRDPVSQRTSICMTEGNTTVHAPMRLFYHASI